MMRIARAAWASPLAIVRSLIEVSSRLAEMSRPEPWITIVRSPSPSISSTSRRDPLQAAARKLDFGRDGHDRPTSVDDVADGEDVELVAADDCETTDVVAGEDGSALEFVDRTSRGRLQNPSSVMCCVMDRHRHHLHVHRSASGRSRTGPKVIDEGPL